MREYLQSLGTVCILVSLVLRLVPTGNIRRVAGFTGGLMILLAVISPLVRIDPDALAKMISAAVVETQAPEWGVKVANDTLMADIIKSQCETYISDKAMQLGMEVQVQITLSEGGSYPYPTGVELRGRWTPSQKASLQKVIADDLGVPIRRQEWISM